MVGKGQAKKLAMWKLELCDGATLVEVEMRRASALDLLQFGFDAHETLGAPVEWIKKVYERFMFMTRGWKEDGEERPLAELSGRLEESLELTMQFVNCGLERLEELRKKTEENP